MPLLVLHLPVYHHSHWVPWASQPQKSATLSPQPGGKPRKFIRTCCGIGGGGIQKGFWGDPHALFYVSSEKKLFQQDGATAHMASNSMAALLPIFRDQIINKYNIKKKI